jgi:hypothetical protein|tara:strand:+ start:46 stop:252 length:207 start_codon:yes stop_codon:yes gene_type:complete
MVTEEDKTNITEISKSQNIRLLDVFFIGPYMIYISKKAKGLSKLESFTLLALGVATIFYNGKNYLKNK